MHIPDSMLAGSICPVTAIVSAIGIIAASYYVAKAVKKPTASQFGAITALIFAGQMMNFQIMSGTSGHLLGGVLAASILGTPFGVLSIALVVAIQSLVFSDGGITVLGANILNMALLGAGMGGMLRAVLADRWQGRVGGYLATAVAACLSVVMASLAVSVELAVDGQIGFSQVVVAMAGAHALIGVGEAIITVTVCMLLSVNRVSQNSSWRVAAPLTTAFLVALLFSPFASGFPDGLEWIADKYAFLHESAPAFVSPLPDYSVAFVSNEMLSTGLAGVIGVLISFAAAWVLLRLMGGLTVRQGVA